MKELQVKLTQAEFEIIDREAFEKNVKEVVEKYQGYTVTAETIQGDKKVVADLRKLVKQISDERIKTKKELSKTATDFDSYIKSTLAPIEEVIGKIADDIKEFENHQKKIRLDVVKAYIEEKSSEKMLDSRLFDEDAQNYLKASNFLADGLSLKKSTKKAIDDLIAFELQKQEQRKKEEKVISSQCSEYDMTDQPYLRMLGSMTLSEVLEQIKEDHITLSEVQSEAQRALNEDNGELHSESIERAQERNESLEKYTQKMTLEVYFKNKAEKDYFKESLEELGFSYKKNYIVSGYRNIVPLTQEELVKEWGND